MAPPFLKADYDTHLTPQWRCVGRVVEKSCLLQKHT